MTRNDARHTPGEQGAPGVRRTEEVPARFGRSPEADAHQIPQLCYCLVQGKGDGVGGGDARSAGLML